MQALQSLQEEQQEAERQQSEEKQRQEDQLRRDIEEARRLRAENEEIEKRRLEEERGRREGSEIDYGIDARSTGGASSTGKSRRKRAPTGSSAGVPRPVRPARGGGSGGSSPNKSKAVVPASFGARAAVMFANVRAMVERMGTTLHANPMLLMRFLAFIIGLVLMFGKKNMRERIARVMGNSWNKVKATASMGAKVSYI